MPRAVDESGCRQCAPGLQVLVDKLFIAFRMVGDSLSTSPRKRVGKRLFANLSHPTIVV